MYYRWARSSSLARPRRWSRTRSSRRRIWAPARSRSGQSDGREFTTPVMRRKSDWIGSACGHSRVVRVGSGREVPRAHRGARIRVAVVAVSTMLVAAGAPLRVSQPHTTPTSVLEPPRMSELAREPVATFGLLAPSSLQGFNPLLSYAFVSALAEVTPPIRVASAHDTVNLLNEQGLAGE